MMSQRSIKASPATATSFEAAPGRDGFSVVLHEPLPEAIEIGEGQFLVLSGDCEAPAGERIVGVTLRAGQVTGEAELSPGLAGPVFWQALYLDAEVAERAIEVEAVVSTAAGHRIEVPLGRIHCRETAWSPETSPASASPDELVAICMATYNPDPAAFRRQVASIREQDFGNWLCIVNDDGTPEDRWREMLACCEGDERFRFARNERNLGFYRNFERALTRVPVGAGYVAFCDQDDYWYPDKLSRLLAAIKEADATLVYSDMRIVDSEGAVVAGSYWTNRRNEYRDLGVVLVANTVTGAASLFRRDLVPHLVPFPPRVGDAFHDHWLACLALSTGRVAYVDEPLYDYYQYGSSVIGHCDFTRFTLGQRAASLVRFVFRLCRPSVARPLLRGKYAASLAIYRGECRRLRLVGQTIRRRCRVGAEAEKVLSLFDGGLRSVAGLLRLHAGVLVKGQTTDDAELRLAMGELARLVERRRAGGKH